MPHPMVLQLRFTRAEFKRALEGLTDDEARRRFMPMNCISWNIGHLAWQEQRYFLFYGQGQLALPEIDERFAYRAPASTPALDEAWSAWRTITEAADPWLDTLTAEKLQRHVIREGRPSRYIFGSLLQRVIYHYWYHTGENMAIRQSLGTRTCRNSSAISIEKRLTGQNNSESAVTHRRQMLDGASSPMLL